MLSLAIALLTMASSMLTLAIALLTMAQVCLAGYG